MVRHLEFRRAANVIRRLCNFRFSHRTAPRFDSSWHNTFYRVPLVKEEEGSISLLVIGLFLLVLTLSLAIVDVAANMVVKMELTHVGEAALSTAAHSLDYGRYYSSDRVFVRDSSKGPIYRVPIDCNIARTKFLKELSVQEVSGSPVGVILWNCDQDALEAQIEVNVSPAMPIPFLSSSLGNVLGESGSSPNTFRIIATVKAESLVVG